MISMKKYRVQLEKLYTDTCTVIEKQKVKTSSKQTRFEDVIVLSDLKCRLSTSSIPSASKGDVSSIEKEIKLFVSPEIDIKPGSKIIVKKILEDGMTIEETYNCCGYAGAYQTHREYQLEIEDKRA